jgi:HEAT repeat protein
MRRVYGVQVAVALGAASKWPDLMRALLDDPDRLIRLTACRALATRGDGESLRTLAAAVVHDPGDEEMQRIVGALVGKPARFDIALASVASDESEPSFARLEAARLAGQHGGDDAGRILARAATADIEVRAAIAAALVQIERRTGIRLRSEAP